jgi:hypothetical protein
MRINNRKTKNHFRKAYNWVYRLWHYRISNIPSDVKYFFQRGTRGYSDRDIWSLDWYLARVISETCKKLAHTTHGYPPSLTPEEWERILLEISNGFEEYLKLQDSDNYDNTEITKEKLNKSLELLQKYFTDLWD